ncbi:hypothetical protein ID853_17425 [Xenorhabdus sp. Vera]|uniref:hypothetical protein n=1 Tax=Xenorhabdus koppenhoeferi TaxID=351659 RepID=UPI0019A2804C|nr:hypothetical protein [Xenorhabdus sp. Vera]MBD2812608.1 hypothetical protein [Xenorhabdus sp. Vera]
MNKVISSIFIVLSLFSSPSFAGKHTESGYIEWLEVALNGDCFGYLKLIQPAKSIGQGFVLKKCIQEKMNLLRTAQLIGLKVELTFEGNGEEYKTLYNVRMYR